MDPTAIVAYMITLGALTLAPGPLVAALAARSASMDRRGAAAMVLGICAGDIFVILAICAGFGLWLQANPEIFIFARYVGAGMLLWMSFRMWKASTAPTDHVVQASGISASILMGFAVCLSTPQTVVMYLVLLPQVTDLTSIGAREMALLIVATTAALLAVFLVVIVFSEATRRVLRSSTGTMMWSRGMSLTIAASAAWVIFG